MRPPDSRQRRLFAAFTDRLGLKVTAVLLAGVLWFMVNAKEPQELVVDVHFTPVLDSSLVLRDAIPHFRAIIAGAPKELIKLSTNPPVIRRQISADAPDTLVLDLRPSDVILPEGVDAVVRELQPRTVTLHFEPTWSHMVPVRSAIEILGPHLPGPVETRFQPESVQVSGPRRRVLHIPSVRTVRTAIPFPDTAQRLVDIDWAALGAGVRVRPSQVKVELKLLPSG